MFSRPWSRAPIRHACRGHVRAYVGPPGRCNASATECRLAGQQVTGAPRSRARAPPAKEVHAQAFAHPATSNVREAPASKRAARADSGRSQCPVRRGTSARRPETQAQTPAPVLVPSRTRRPIVTRERDTLVQVPGLARRPPGNPAQLTSIAEAAMCATRAARAVCAVTRPRQNVMTGWLAQLIAAPARPEPAPTPPRTATVPSAARAMPAAPPTRRTSASNAPSPPARPPGL